MGRLRLEKFDPSKLFITAAAFRASGVAWGKGFPFDAFSVDERTLRLLYEQRKLVYADSELGKKLLRGSHITPEVLQTFTDSQREAALAAAEAVAEEESVIVKRLVDKYSKAELLAKAEGLGDVKSRDSKTEIATVLVRYGIVT